MVATTVIRSLNSTPVVPHQAPGTARRLDQRGEQRCQRQRDQGVPGGRLHHQLGATDRLGVPAGHPEDSERQEAGDRTQPAVQGRGPPSRRGSAGWVASRADGCRCRRALALAVRQASYDDDHHYAPVGMQRSAAPPTRGSAAVHNGSRLRAACLDYPSVRESVPLLVGGRQMSRSDGQAVAVRGARPPVMQGAPCAVCVPSPSQAADGVLEASIQPAA
jgi:hypothetical protein